MPLLEAVIFSSLWAFGVGQLEQPEMSITKMKGQSAEVSCKVSLTNFNDVYIHWYHQKPNQNIEHLLYVQSTTSPTQKYSDVTMKFEARKDSSTSTSTLKINFLAKGDEGMYYCACWMHNIRLTKITYTKTTSDRNLEEDYSPKPTVFLPSVAEINLHKAGTYLCILEKFYPDVIKIDWKEKNGDKILKSQEGDTIRTIHTYITYMKFSWLTVTETSMDKGHVCVVKHEFNREGIDQEIFFPSIMEVKENFSNTYTETTTVLGTLTPTGKEDCLEYTTPAVVTDENNTDNYLKKFSLEDESRSLQLQFPHTSAYYTYVLLLLKSVIYFAIIAFSLFRRRGACCNGKIP